MFSVKIEKNHDILEARYRATLVENAERKGACNMLILIVIFYEKTQVYSAK